MAVKVQAFSQEDGILQFETYDISARSVWGNSLEQFKQQFPQYATCIVVSEATDTWIETAYSPANDTTFIMKYHRDADGLIDREEVIGFYHGEPDPELTFFYQDKGTIASV